MLYPLSRSACNEDDPSNMALSCTPPDCCSRITTLCYDDIHHSHTITTLQRHTARKKTTMHPPHSPRSRNDNYNFTFPHTVFLATNLLYQDGHYNGVLHTKKKAKSSLFIIISYFAFLFSCRGNITERLSERSSATPQ